MTGVLKVWACSPLGESLCRTWKVISVGLLRIFLRVYKSHLVRDEMLGCTYAPSFIEKIWVLWVVLVTLNILFCTLDALISRDKTSSNFKILSCQRHVKSFFLDDDRMVWYGSWCLFSSTHILFNSTSKIDIDCDHLLISVMRVASVEAFLLWWIWWTLTSLFLMK